jgi:hypothetical protein
LLEAFLIPGGENYVRSLAASTSRSLKANAGASADNHDSLSEEFRFALRSRDDGCGVHDSSNQSSTQF